MDLMNSRIYLPLDTKMRNLFACTKLLFDKSPQTQPSNYFRPNLPKKQTIKNKMLCSPIKYIFVDTNNTSID